MAGNPLPAGILHTSGNQILDASNNPVRVCSVSWNTDFANIASTVQKVRDIGFNTIRLEWVDVTRSSDWARADQVIAACKVSNMRVILAHISNETLLAAAGGQQGNGLWFDSGAGSDNTNGNGTTGTITDAMAVANWVECANRYKTESYVIGFDLHHEPFNYGSGSEWGSGGVRDIRSFYQRAGSAIQGAGYTGLIICQGVQNFSNGIAFTGAATTPCPWGDLSGVRNFPVTLTNPNKVVYSAHVYANEVMGFSPDSGPTCVTYMMNCFGFVHSESRGPVFIGAMGSTMKTGLTNEAWAGTMLDLMNGLLSAQGGISQPTGVQQGMHGSWVRWGNAEAAIPNGIMDVSGQVRQEQFAVYSRMFWTTVLPPGPGGPESANNTQVTTVGALIIDATGNSWALTANGRVARNTVEDQTTSNVVGLAYVNHVVWHKNTAGLWFSWTGTVWSAGTANSPLPVASADHTRILLTTDAPIINAVGESYTLLASSSGAVAVNGVMQVLSTNVVEITYKANPGLVYKKLASGAWWYQARSTDAWVLSSDPFPAPPVSTVTKATVDAAIAAVIAELTSIRTDVGTLSP